MEPPHRDFRRMAVEEFDTSKLLAHASRQARDRGYDKFPIVDVDSHHYELESLGEILEYMDDPVLQQLAMSATQSGGSKGTGVLPGGVGYQDIGGRVLRYSTRRLEKVSADEHRDVQLTRRWMDAVGTDIAGIFSSPML